MTQDEKKKDGAGLAAVYNDTTAVHANQLPHDAIELLARADRYPSCGARPTAVSDYEMDDDWCGACEAPRAWHLIGHLADALRKIGCASVPVSDSERVTPERSAMKEINDSGAALLPVDPSAAVKTEPLPTAEEVLGILRPLSPSAAVSPEPQWQPIETAPKDGTLIDLWVQSKGPVSRDSDEQCVYVEFRVPGAQRWGGEWLNADGNPHSDLDGFTNVEVTHWMPLPSPPSGAEE
jgi:hypothetical protein